MKKVIKILVIILLVIVLVLASLQLWIYFDHIKAKKVLVVVKNYYESFYGVDEEGLLYSVKFDNPRKVNGKDLKKGQEIEIYWHGITNFSYPAGIGGVRKYKILKEESDIEIPDYAIKHCCNSTKNVMVHVREITNERMNFRILDTNEIPYEYEFNYSLSKKNIENEEYNEKLKKEFKEEQIIEKTTNKKGVTTVTNTIEPFNPDVSKYKTVYEEIEKISFSNENIIEIVDSTNGHFDIEGQINWNEIYGTLEPGEYQFTLKNKKEDIHYSCIVFRFVVEENGEVVCQSPTFEW